jgi:hypothetical protein
VWTRVLGRPEALAAGIQRDADEEARRRRLDAAALAAALGGLALLRLGRRLS